MKTCSKCKENKPSDKFYSCKNTKDRLQTYCKECSKEANRINKKKPEAMAKRRKYDRKYHADNPHIRRNIQLKMKYGINEDTWDDMYAEQDGKCAICSEHGVPLVVDHDHTTQDVRGLLCHGCNTGLGLLKDSVVNLQASIRYLEV